MDEEDDFQLADDERAFWASSERNTLLSLCLLLSLSLEAYIWFGSNFRPLKAQIKFSWFNEQFVDIFRIACLVAGFSKIFTVS